MAEVEEVESIEVGEDGYPIGYSGNGGGNISIPDDIDVSNYNAVKIDKSSGAPVAVRNAVGAARTPQDRLLTLKNFYPDAESYDGDNFIFTDPVSGNETLFNPSGFDVGDLTENGRLVAEFIGGMGGTAAAVIAGQAGPQIATPEEIATIPVAASLGSEFGGQAYDTVLDFIYPVAIPSAPAPAIPAPPPPPRPPISIDI